MTVLIKQAYHTSVELTVGHLDLDLDLEPVTQPTFSGTGMGIWGLQVRMESGHPSEEALVALAFFTLPICVKGGRPDQGRLWELPGIPSISVRVRLDGGRGQEG